MQERRQQMIEELSKLEQARDLLREVEGSLAREGLAPENYLMQLERLEESFPEGHMARLLVESAVGAARARSAIKAGSDVSRSCSAIEGEISTLRGVVSRESAKDEIPD